MPRCWVPQPDRPLHVQPWSRMGLPNKRLKLTGPAFRGSGRLCASMQIPQRGSLAPAGVRPAA